MNRLVCIIKKPMSVDMKKIIENDVAIYTQVIHEYKITNFTITEHDFNLRLVRNLHSQTTCFGSEISLSSGYCRSEIAPKLK